MTIIGVRVKVDAKLVAKGMQDLGAEIPKIGRLQIYNVMVRSRSRLRKPGAKPKYPIPWDSIKQKIKVIIILKHVLHELPYRRRGEYQKGFKIVKLPEGYDLVNDKERARYVSGDSEGKGQSRIFRGRYPIMREVIDQEFAKLPSAVVQHIEIAAKSKGFKVG